jgi:hypothetical protein
MPPVGRPYGRLAPLFLAAILVFPVSASATERPSADSTPYGPYEDAPVETSFEANDAEVLFYANKHDVPIERAIEIANWMEDATPLLTSFGEMRNIYTDVRLVHGGTDQAPDLAPGEIRVEVLATDLADADLGRAIAGLRSLRVGQFAAEIAVERAPLSLAELDALAATQLIGMDPSTVEIKYDLRAGEVTLTPATQRPDTMWANQCTNQTGATLDGGRRIRLDRDQQAGCQTETECTSGFPMRLNFAYGVTTAGHCTDAIGANYGANASGFVLNYTDRDTDMYWVFQPNTIYVTANAYWHDGPAIGPDDDDVAFLRRTSTATTYAGQIWKWDTSEWRNIIGYEASSAPYGITVCEAASPAALNPPSTYCGEVIDPVTNAFGVDSGFQRWTEVDFTQGDYNRDKSGGPGARVEPCSTAGSSMACTAT